MFFVVVWGGSGDEEKLHFQSVLCQVHYRGHLLGYHAAILYIILSLVMIDSVSVQFGWLIGHTVFCTVSGTKSNKNSDVGGREKTGQMGTKRSGVGKKVLAYNYYLWLTLDFELPWVIPSGI